MTILLIGSCVVVTTLVFPVQRTVSAQIRTTATGSTTLSSADSEARHAFVQAEALRMNWTEASLREAIELYDKAAVLWTSISEFVNASDANLKSGEVYFIFGEYKRALERYENAEQLAGRAGEWLAQAKALSQIGRTQSYLGNNALAETHITRALKLLEQSEGKRTAGAMDAYGEALSDLAEVSYAKGDFVKASMQLERVLEILPNDHKSQAKAHLFNGYIAGSIGQPERALAEIQQALELFRKVNDKGGEALGLTAMGLWHSSKRDEDRAIEMHNKAQAIFSAIGHRYSEGIALNAIGQAYHNLNEYSNALAYYQRALELFDRIGALYAASAATWGIAETQYERRDLDQALVSYERCLKLSRTAGNRRIEAFALNRIANVYSARGRHEQALKKYQNIQMLFKRIGDLRGQAEAMNSQGDFFLQIGQKEKALDAYRQAFSLSEKMGDNGILISTLYSLARANLALGSHDSALALVRRSFDLIEAVRANVESPDFRSSYFSGVRRHYDLCIEILMQLERLRPGQGFATEAFFVSEQSRARLLIDLLSESRVNIREGTAKELLEREGMLRGLLQKHATYQMSLSLSGKDSIEIAEADAAMAELRSKYQAVQAQLREKNPRLFDFEQFEPMRLESIQKELDDNTILLEYSLGDAHSYLWAVTSNSIHSYELADRKTIEDAAGDLFNVITARQGSLRQNGSDYLINVERADKLYPEQANNLSKMLLGPVAARLGNKRLIFTTEGALQYIPFDALPVPSSQAAGPTKMLAETNEVVVLPSASTLIAIRGAHNNKRSPTGKLIAIIADPVFSRSDERVRSEPLSPTLANAAADKDSVQLAQQTFEKLSLPRLVYASQEADTISAAAPWGTTLVAKGFDANFETVLSSEISRAQIIHFATHGFLDSEHPELSGIVLTMTDRNGARTNGLMALPDIYGLDLSAELTVLSACQTALGKDVKGEGLVGLTHSFISAGSKSVVASLWKVDDRATAVLMAEFYRNMLQKSMTPAAALRAAKLKMMQDKQWSAPFYWAGFVLQGEYTKHIVVNRNSWLQPPLVIIILLTLIAATVLVFHKLRRRISPRQFT